MTIVAQLAAMSEAIATGLGCPCDQSAPRERPDEFAVFAITGATPSRGVALVLECGLQTWAQTSARAFEMQEQAGEILRPLGAWVRTGGTPAATDGRFVVWASTWHVPHITEN